MLCSIDQTCFDEARRILTLLCFSTRPLTVTELIHATAIDLEEPAHLDYERLLEDANDLRAICPGLIEIDFEADDKTDDEETNEVTDANINMNSDIDGHADGDENGDADADAENDTDSDEASDEPEVQVPVVRIAHFSVHKITLNLIVSRYQRLLPTNLKGVLHMRKSLRHVLHTYKSQVYPMKN